jgi:hypothetical protein
MKESIQGFSSNGCFRSPGSGGTNSIGFGTATRAHFVKSRRERMKEFQLNSLRSVEDGRVRMVEVLARKPA